MLTAAVAAHPLEGLKVRLERNHQSVLRLMAHMNSYRYEPHSYEGFVRLRHIQVSLKELAAEQKLLLYATNGATEDADTLYGRALECTQTFKALEKDITSYIWDAKGFPG